VNNVLTNPNVIDQAAVFLQIAVANLAAKPETLAVLLQITQSTLAQLISQESTLALISDLLGRAAIQVAARFLRHELVYFFNAPCTCHQSIR
jgi:hypothetical protein